MVQLIKGREPLLEMGLPQIFANAMALGYKKAYQEQAAKKQQEALVSRMLMQEQMRRNRETTKPTKIDYYDPGDILTQARGQYSMYVPMNEYNQTIQDLSGAGYQMGTMKQPGLPTLGTTRDIKRGTQTVQQEYTGQGWQPIGGGPRFKPSTPSIPNQGSALKELKIIAKEKANLEKSGDIISAFLVTMNPDVFDKGMIGQKMSQQDKNIILERMNFQIEYLNKFVPKKAIMKPFTVSEEETSTGLPAGLTEKDIQYNMKKYGKTRQEVIEAYNRKFGNMK